MTLLRQLASVAAMNAASEPSVTCTSTTTANIVFAGANGDVAGAALNGSYVHGSVCMKLSSVPMLVDADASVFQLLAGGNNVTYLDAARGCAINAATPSRHEL